MPAFPAALLPWQSQMSRYALLQQLTVSLYVGIQGPFAMQNNGLQVTPAVQTVSVPPVDVYLRPATLKGLPREVTLYQYEVCPFCCKVKAFLDYNKVCIPNAAITSWC